MYFLIIIKPPRKQGEGGRFKVWLPACLSQVGTCHTQPNSSFYGLSQYAIPSASCLSLRTYTCADPHPRGFAPMDLCRCDVLMERFELLIRRRVHNHPAHQGPGLRCDDRLERRWEEDKRAIGRGANSMWSENVWQENRSRGRKLCSITAGWVLKGFWGGTMGRAWKPRCGAWVRHPWKARYTVGGSAHGQVILHRCAFTGKRACREVVGKWDTMRMQGGAFFWCVKWFFLVLLRRASWNDSVEIRVWMVCSVRCSRVQVCGPMEGQ